MSLKNNKNETRKIQFSGNSSFTTTLPKQWVEHNNLKAGEEITLVYNSDNEIVITPNNKIISNNKEIRIDIDKEDYDTILRKIVSTEEGTAGFANVSGYEIGGKTGTADVAAKGGYSKKKINTFASIFPTSNPKFVLVVMLDEPKANKEFVYHYRDGRNPYKGNWRNTAGWTTVWIAGQIIEKIGPILATNY